MAELDKLRKMVADSSGEFKHMDVGEKTLHRYLVAHKSADAAYKKICATNAWRRDFGVASITEDSPGVQRAMKTKVFVALKEYDKWKRPVSVVAVRNHNLHTRNLDDFTEYIAYNLEEGEKYFQEESPEQFCMIYDLKDFSMKCMDYPVVKRIYTTLTDHYPERLGLCLVLNAPVIFTACWTIIRAWLDENTANKIKFVKTEELSEYLDPSILPEL